MESHPPAEQERRRCSSLERVSLTQFFGKGVHSTGGAWLAAPTFGEMQLVRLVRHVQRVGDTRC